MIVQAEHTVCLFDRFCLVIPASLKYHQDELPGNRVLLISNEQESFTVFFEEGMQMTDMLPLNNTEPSCQYCKNGKYIHQRNVADPMGRCAFFHIELDDEKGRTAYLPGRMTAKSHYPWAEGIEPVLLELMEGLSLLSDGPKEE